MTAPWKSGPLWLAAATLIVGCTSMADGDRTAAAPEGEPDAWGSDAQSNEPDSAPSTAATAPGDGSTVGRGNAQTQIRAAFPVVGQHATTADWADRNVAFAPLAPAAAPVDAGADAPAEGADEAAPQPIGLAEFPSSIPAPDADAVDAADAGGPDVADNDAEPDANYDPGADAGVDADEDADATAGPSPVAWLDAAPEADSASPSQPPAGASPEAGSPPPATGGYTIQCPWLLDTSGMLTHLRSSADFYVNVADTQSGGFFTYLDQTGTPTSTNKSFEVQSRDAYAFARAFMVSGDETYLAAARSALDFLYAHAWDQTHGGFVFLGDRQGNWLPAPSGVPSDKWSFTQHYAFAGPTAMCEATENATDCGWMNQGMQLLETHYWDPTFGGYFNNANLDYTSTSEKGFTPTIDGITPHILLSYLVTQNASYRSRFVSLSDDAANHLVGSMTAPGVIFGFPEFYNSDWSIETGNTYGFVGHLYKTAWALARAYLVTNDSKYRDAARQLLAQLWSGGGFDHTNGAPNFDYNFNSGVGSTNKEYWQIEQAFTSGITNWSIATNDADRAIYLEQADRSLCFFMTHLPDAQFGGIFFETNADGSSLVGDGSDGATDKGDQWEGSYHNSELSYYAYLYGNLLLWQKPVTLYYRFDPGAESQAFTLSPLENSDALVITGVELGGSPYTNFDGRARTLSLPAGTGGVFAVTYARAM